MSMMKSYRIFILLAVLVIMASIVYFFLLPSGKEEDSGRGSSIQWIINDDFEDDEGPAVFDDPEPEVIQKIYARDRKNMIFSQHSSPLSELYVEKFETGLSGGNMKAIINPSVGGFNNNLRGLFSALLFCIVADCVVIVNNGIGRNHKGNMLDYFSAKDPKLQKWLRYEDHSKDAGWGAGGFMYSAKAFYRNFEDNDPEIVKFISESKPYVEHMVDGPGVHYCVKDYCKALQTVGNFEYDEKNQKITKTVSINQVFKGKLKANKASVVLKNNNIFTQHVFKDPTKMKALCDLGVCKGIENYVFNGDIINYKNYPNLGYPYLGSKLGGNIFNELFELHPRLKPDFDGFVEEYVDGFLLGLQIRAGWMKDPPNANKHTPQWSEWVKAAESIISEEQLKKSEEEEEILEFTIFVACDLPLSNNFLEELSNLEGVRKVVTKEDYPFFRDSKSSHPKPTTERIGFENTMHAEDAILSVVYDFNMLTICDATVITFVSSFGQIAANSCGLTPSYVLFHESQLPKNKNISPLQRARIYSWWVLKWDDIIGHWGWLFDNIDVVYDEEMDYVV